MPTYTIEAPDGRRIKVEAESPELAMQGVQEYVASNPKTGGLPPEGTSRAPTAPAEDGSFRPLTAIDSALRGLPFLGGYRDELRARSQSWVNGTTYEEELAKERARDKAFQDAHPYLDTGIGIASGVGATLAAAPLLGAAGTGGAVAAAGRTALGVGSKTLPGAIARGATAGALQGAAAGSGEAEGGFVDRAYGGVMGAGVGAAVGGAAPAVFEGARRAGSAALRKVMPGDDPLSALSSGAQRYVGEISDPARVARMQQDLQRLGPDGMLADVSPEWQAVARGAAARPGTRDTVVDALQGRDAGKNARLASDLDASLGRAPVPSQVEQGLAAARNDLGPAYERAMEGARAVNTRDLAEDLEGAAVNLRGPAQRAVREVRQMLDIPGNPGNLDPHPRALLSTRQAIDGLLATENNPQAQRALTSARARIDAELGRAVPGIKDVDAQFAELSRQSEGLQRGSQLLDGGKTAIRPQELGPEIAQSALPQGRQVGPSAAPLRMQQGARAEIDRIAGTNANDPVALQRLVKGEGDWNRDKLRQVYGQERADQALGAIDREARFNETTNRVTRGSDTAMGSGFKSFLDRAERPITGGEGIDMTAFGAAISVSRRIGSVLTGALGKERANRYATELARTAIATGVDRDEFVAALTRAGVKQGLVARTLDMATRGGLIGSREAPGLVLPQRERE